jgi:Short C-terminal domain
MLRRGPGLVRGVARTAVVAGTASAVAGRVNHRQQQKWAAQDQQAYEQQAYEQQQAAAAQQAAAPAPAPAAGGGDLAAEIERLANLKAQGVLSEEEFQAAKAKLISG